MRTLSLRNLYAKKHETFPFQGIWKETMGEPEQSGLWLVYGAEKNGKTWFSLKLAEYLSSFAKTLYISAEEGMSKTFVEACQRAKLDHENKNLGFLDYIALEDLDEKLSKRKSAKIVIFDNITIYADELKYGGLKRLRQKHSNKLLIFIAHEERGEPYTATAKMARRYAQIIVRVKGLACFISGRCPGGRMDIDEEKASIYHGQN